MCVCVRESAPYILSPTEQKATEAEWVNNQRDNDTNNTRSIGATKADQNISQVIMLHNQAPFVG